MKVALGFLLLCGAMLSVDAVCNELLCTQPTPHTESNRCANYKAHLDCLKAQMAGCTVVFGKDTLQRSIDAFESVRNGIECGAAAITISVFTLVLSLMAAILKL